MKTMTLAIAAAVAASTFASAQEAVQWRVEDGGNGHWYDLARQGTTVCWHDARQLSIAAGGHLATLTSLDEHQFVVAFVAANNPGTAENGPYLGATCENAPWGQWSWVTGEEFSFTAWNPGEPNNGGGGDERYVHLWNWTLLGWNDAAACDSSTYSFVMEWSADCNGDGIVDYGQCRDGSLPDYNGNNIPDCCEQGVPCEVGNYPVQWRVEDGGNGHWYQLVISQEPLTQQDARQQAIARGGDLLSACGTEFDWVIGANRIVRAAAWVAPSWQPNDLLGPWIGLTVVGDSWAWIDNSACTFDRWDESCGQPDGLDGAAALYSCGFGSPASPGGVVHDIWSDAPAVSYLAEYSADCNGDGFVDYGQILLGELGDSNANGVPDVCECDADINDDGTVNGADISVLLGYWGQSGKGIVGDITSDGIVNGADLAQLLGSWGPCQ